MTKIDAWIYDPQYALFKGSSKRVALFVLWCERPETCDLLAKEQSCLHCGGLAPCRFGRKAKFEGPTRAARSFSDVLVRWKQDHADVMGKLKSLTAYQRIFRTHGYYYLPYSFMTRSFGDGNPLGDDPWVPEADMTPALLERICRAQPTAMMGGVIPAYQKESVPKFIADLKAFYPEVFERLLADQKARLATVSYVGRKADLATCEPGEYRFGTHAWRWDGELLHGSEMIFPPVPGEVAITIRPEPGSSVEITSNAQVSERTRFLD